MEAAALWVGFVAAIGTILQLSGEVIKYIEDTTVALAERQSLLREIIATNEVLRSFEDRAKRDDCKPSTNALKALQEPLDQIRVVFESLKRDLRPAHTTAGRIVGSTTWYFSKHKINNMVSKISRFNALFTSVLQNEHLALSESIKSDLQTVKTDLENVAKDFVAFQTNQKDQSESGGEDQKLLNWLSPLTFWAMHSDTFGRRQPGTGEWLLVDERFQSWISGETKYLWCPAGVGKTILFSIAIDFLHEEFSNIDDIGIAFVYFDHARTVTAEDIIGSLLKHLVQRRRNPSKVLTDLYSQHAERGTHPTYLELSKVLEKEARGFSKVFVVIDALDECPVQNDTRTKILKELSKLSTVRVMMTGRPHVTAVMLSSFGEVGEVQIRARDEDIDKYTDERLHLNENLHRHCLRSEGLEETIRETVVSKAGGMFLMAKLHIDLLAEQLTEREVNSALENLPVDLSEAYGSVMKRISAQKEKQRHLAMTTLKWITYAKEPLKGEELQHALAVTPESTDINEKDFVDIDSLVSFCVGIVTVDPKSGIIRLVHYTVQKYLEKQFPQVQANTEIARTCLGYLAFDAFSMFCEDTKSFEERVKKYKFSSYAGFYWADHVREGAEDQLHPLILATFESEGKRDSMLQLQVQYYSRAPYKYSLLHLAASEGLSNLCKALLSNWKRGNILRRKFNWRRRRFVDAKDWHGMTPLGLAARNGHAEVVRLLLLDGKAAVDTPDLWGWTALIYAAAGRHVGVVKVLLDANAAVDVRDNDDSTALIFAAFRGDVEVVKLLLGANASVDVRARDDRTPLISAALCGHVDVVKLLLNANAPVDSQDRVGETALMGAAGEGHVDVVKLLLDANAAVDIRGKNDWTSLFWAAEQGNAEVVKLLLEANAVVDVRSSTGPYNWSHPQVVRVDAAGDWTPLRVAVWRRNVEVVRLLLDADASVDVQDELGETALLVAVREGDVEMVKLLVSANASVEVEDINGDTPLIRAVKQGYCEIVQLLIDANADVNQRPQRGKTALSCAASEGNVAMVKLLLGANALVDVKDDVGWDALRYAAEGGHVEIVNLLANSTNSI